MWLLLGGGAIFFALVNLGLSLNKKGSKWFSFASLSLTALTLCAFYSDGAIRVRHEDWAGLMDIMPTMSKALWICVIASILFNAVPLLREKK